MVQRQKVDVVMGYISSGDCLAIPSVADELKQLTVLIDCGTLEFSKKLLINMFSELDLMQQWIT